VRYNLRVKGFRLGGTPKKRVSHLRFTADHLFEREKTEREVARNSSRKRKAKNKLDSLADTRAAPHLLPRAGGNSPPEIRRVSISMEIAQKIRVSSKVEKRCQTEEMYLKCAQEEG